MAYRQRVPWLHQLSRNTNEIRIQLAPADPAHQGAVLWSQYVLPIVADENPMLSITVHTTNWKDYRARLVAGYDRGEERWIDIQDLTCAEISDRLKELNDLGKTMPRGGASELKGEDNRLQDHHLRALEHYDTHVNPVPSMNDFQELKEAVRKWKEEGAPAPFEV